MHSESVAFGCGSVCKSNTTQQPDHGAPDVLQAAQDLHGCRFSVSAIGVYTSHSREDMHLRHSRLGGRRPHNCRQRSRLGSGLRESPSPTTHHDLGEKKQLSVREIKCTRQPTFQALLSASHHGYAHKWRAPRHVVNHPCISSTPRRSHTQDAVKEKLPKHPHCRCIGRLAIKHRPRKRQRRRSTEACSAV